MEEKITVPINIDMTNLDIAMEKAETIKKLLEEIKILAQEVKEII